ncbi:MAG: hypothetical protein ACK4PI_07020 [Tepidisphaerales bacterium]
MASPRPHDRHSLLAPGLLAALLLACPLAAAGQTRTWTHGTEADFRQATLERVVVANTGEVRLSRQLTPVLPDTGDIPLVMSLAEAPDGTVYVGTGPSGRVLSVRADGGVEELLRLEPGEMATAVHVRSDGSLLVGVSGTTARLLHLTPNGTRDLLADVADLAGNPPSYIWAILAVAGPEGGIYIATGPHGLLLRLPEGAERPQRFVELEEDNLLCLAATADNALLVGTDPRGLVYRIDLASKARRVLLDAPQDEVVAVRVGREGRVYVAAASPAGDDTQASIPDRGQPDGLAMPVLPEFPDNLRPPPPTPRGFGVSPGQPAPPNSPPPNSPPPNSSNPNSPPTAEPQGVEPDAPPPEPPSAEPESASPRADESSSTPRPITSPPSPDDQPRSAVYQIDPEGFSTELLTLPASIRDLELHENTLFIATGPGGQLYELELTTDEVTVAARAEADHLTRLLLRRDGSLLVGTGDTGSVVQLGTRFASDGTLTSHVLDAGHAARFGMIRLDGTLPEGTAVRVSARSGNTDEPTESGWSSWSDPVPVERFTPAGAPVGRYFQYRLTLQSSPDGSATPSVREVEVAYRIPNLPPKVTSVQAQRAEGDNATPTQWTLKWEADDANGDSLRYRVEYRPVNDPMWRPLREDLKETELTWDTREIPDGRYQIRVVAEDALSNPPETGRRGARASRAFLVDNTPPRFGTPRVITAGAAVTVRIPVVDGAGVVRELAYRVGASEEWRPAEAGDTLFDSPQEEAVVVLRGLPPGRHVVSLRAKDDSANESFETVIVSVPAGNATGRGTE